MAERQDESDVVFGTAAERFALLATPIRLKMISARCHGEKHVSRVLGDIDTTQPNMSRHLCTPYRAGVPGKRRDATRRAAMLCRTVCTRIAAVMHPDAEIAGDERLTPRRAPLR